MELEELQDALKEYDETDSVAIIRDLHNPAYVDVLAEAARLVADGKRIRWCTQHGTRAGPEAEECLVKDEWGRRHDCVIVDATVVIDPRDTE